jgi:hypothetical protein
MSKVGEKHKKLKIKEEVDPQEDQQNDQEEETKKPSSNAGND